jgi:UDPglucose--hexose-1-phosphate uridylyltransferase
MPELRKDLFTDNWVIIAEGRDGRPIDYSQGTVPANDPADCPFEPGHESMTPPEIDAIRPSASKNADDWQVRVVPNKFSALSPQEPRSVPVKQGLFQRMNGTGSHEVVIESPAHSRRLSDFSPEQVERVLRIFQRRLRTLLGDERFQFVQIFRNEGREAGASLVHPHSQILALPFLPISFRDRLQASRKYYAQKQRCILCDVLEQELEKDERVISAGDSFVVLAPYAPRHPYELWIVPRQHRHDLRDLGEPERLDLAERIPETLRKLDDTLVNPPFNLLVRTAPTPNHHSEHPSYLEDLSEHFHWYLEVIPRIKRTAGLELATETHINTIAPETAAQTLRNGTT